MEKTENTAFRMLYVLAIVMVADGHVGSFDYLSLNELLRYQNYHIALFMFASGYFLNLTRGFGTFFKVKAGRILVPLFLWNIFYGGVCFFLNRYAGFSLGGKFDLYNLFVAPFTDGHQFIYNMGAWFLVPLFLVQSLGFVVLKPFEKDGTVLKSAVWFFFCFSLGLGAAALSLGPENGGERNFALMWLRCFYFMPSFAFGVLYRCCLEKCDRLPSAVYFFLVMGAVTVLCQAYPGYNHIPSWLDTVYAPWWVIYLISFLAILFWLRVAKILSPLVGSSRTLEYLSKHTFDVMMHHFAGFMLIKAALSGARDFNVSAFHRDIWYYYFPAAEELCQWGYIFITIVIALSAGFTGRFVCAKLNKTVVKKIW